MLSKEAVCRLTKDECLALPVSFEKPVITENIGSLRVKHIEHFFPLGLELEFDFAFLDSLSYCDYQTEIK